MGVIERAAWLLLGIVLVVDGVYSLLQNERGEALRETVEDILGERADHYLVAGLLGLGEMLAGIWLVWSAVVPSPASRERG